MESKIIGKVVFEDKKLEEDLNCIRSFEFSNAYSEYSSGEWRICMLWNKSGNNEDALSLEYDSHAVPTAYGSQLSYINALLEDLFIIDYLKSVRIFSSRNNGLILPHLDYLEFKKGFTRIHIPLQISIDSLSSEEDVVYSMRKGEIWFLEGRKIHSAGNFSNKERYNLVIDFDPNLSFKSLFRDPALYNEQTQPQIIEREDFDDQDYAKIKSLGTIINKFNFNDILGILGKIHFYKKVSSAVMFDWLLEIAEMSGDQYIREKAEAVTALLIRRGPKLVQAY